jgi:hypothetical protein
MTFLPKDYSIPKTGGNYMKFVKGENRFRIMSSAVVGWEYWTRDNKPVRSVTPFSEVPEDAKMDDNGNFRPKHFWAFVVWNYEEERLQILEITQSTVMAGIEALVHNAKWGDPKKFDIVVKATGDGMEREYSVVPEPHTEAPKADASGIVLEELFSGNDPFKGRPEAVLEEETPRPEDIPF